MPRSHNLSPETLRHVASRISERLGRLAAQSMTGGAAAELTETFEVWFLGREAVARPHAALSDLASRTGYWHHQIRIGGHAAEYARSRPFGGADEDWAVHGLARSDLPGRIDVGIGLIDADPSLEDTYVRLLLAPAFLTSSLWLTDPDGRERVLPVMVPASFRHVVEGTLLDASSFLAALGREPHSRGMPRTRFPPPPSRPRTQP